MSLAAFLAIIAEKLALLLVVATMSSSSKGSLAAGTPSRQYRCPLRLTLAGVWQDFLGETVNSLSCEVTGRVNFLGFEVPREARARLFFLFQFLGLPNGVDEIGGFRCQVRADLV